MELETGFSMWVADCDYSSLYPSIMRALNCSRMTMTFAPYAIDGKPHAEVRRYFSNLINVRENVVTLCADFHGLPSYAEMAKLVGAMGE